MTYYPQIGSVSSGTLRSEDLLDAFASELSYHMKRMRLSRQQRKSFNALLREVREATVVDGDDYGDNNSELVDELQDALSEISTPYSYFGASEGDGSCFGFWPIVDNDELPRINAGYYKLSPDLWGRDIYLVDDYGNVTCGHVNKRGKFVEYWSCV